MSATKPSRREQRAQAQHFINTLEGTAFPNSKRIHITGSQPDIRIPMREIQLSPTLIGGSKEHRNLKTTKPCRCTTPPGRMAILTWRLTSSRAWRNCASRGSRRVTTAKN
ncbi:hypothetical protein ACNKHK_26060 [Shigella flexneri]